MDIEEYYENDKLIALIDRTVLNDTKVILIDQLPKKYIQRFWQDCYNDQLVDRCILMRKLHIESL